MKLIKESLKGAADLVYTFRFIRMLVMKWEEWDAYKEGIIDDNGKRIKSVKLSDSKKRDAWTPFIRLAANTKRLISKVPGGKSRLGGLAAGLLLIKEKYGLNDKQLEKILEKANLKSLDFLSEDNQWFILEDGAISPGVYRLKDSKVVNSTYEELVLAKDQVRISEDCQPVGNVFGLNVYPAIHLKTNQEVYITNVEISR